MLGPNKYHQSATSEPYESALISDEYKALTDEWIAAEERYDEAVSRHEEWKTARAKEAWTEKLRVKEEAPAAKLEALRQQELEKEKEQLQLEAKEEQQQLDLKQKELEEATAKAALEAAMVKKALDDLVKAKEKEDEDNEKLLAAARIVLSGKDGNSELDLMDPKTVAMAELRKRRKIAERKKAGGEDDGNASAGLLRPKHLKMDPEPMAQDKVFTGSGHCGKCHTDKATVLSVAEFIYASSVTLKRRDSSAVEGPSILELLQDISLRLTCLEDKVDAVMGCMEDLVDDYDVDNKVKYPEDFISKSIQAKFEASRLELWKTGDIYCEVLHEVAKHRLDRDMALSSDLPLRMDNPYEILNKSFWIGSIGTTGLCDKMLAHNKFLQAY
ncbi:hypothetical protein ARMSODRAFT_981419 [Armillaria solidipes]|uniref:Uncharacterized protein n=1 Tax=Armillaria solidipes TaxID=1076256 RepID=A0A2H3B6M1_9AGAR|nr:hypothetical protein ARMSODRAFT_981419 [Armillaria solidipes]